MLVRRCLHCDRIIGARERRGLCWGCQSDADIRRRYPKKSRARVDRPEWSESEDEVIRRMFRQWFTDRAISLALGRSGSAVKNRRKKLGMKVKVERRSYTQSCQHNLRVC